MTTSALPEMTLHTSPAASTWSPSPPDFASASGTAMRRDMTSRIEEPTRTWILRHHLSTQYPASTIPSGAGARDKLVVGRTPNLPQLTS